MKIGILLVTLILTFYLAKSPAGNLEQLPHHEAYKERLFKVAVISDLNSGYGSTIYHPDVKATLSELAQIKPDLILCAGDMVAGQKTTLTEQNLIEMWQSFNVNVLSPIRATGTPFAFTLGNHDASLI
jgi:Icc-related predicted phosphoesterase